MEVVRDPRLISGFIYDNPLPRLAAVTHCGEAVTTRQHALDAHRHAGFEFMLACRGSYTWATRGRQYRQRAGDVFVAFPGQPHRTAPVAHPVCHQLWLGVRLDELGGEGARLAAVLTAGQHHLLAGCPEAEPLLRGIVQQAVGARPQRDEVAAAYLVTLVRLLSQRLSRPVSAAVEPAGIRYSYPVLKAMALMRGNLSERLAISDLARAGGLSASQLCRQFRQEVGHSPAQYHRQLRLDAAKERLLAPGSSIANTAVSCGFSSSQHLSKVFRDSVGMTPGAWRRAARPAPRPDGTVVVDSYQ
jgi:AraC-like DNA-binding protein